MNRIPTPWTVKRHAFTPSTTGGYDGPGTWATEGVDVAVHSWAPAGADSAPSEQQRSSVIRDVDLLVPAGTESAPRDRWVVGGETFDQVGHAEDFTHGPFGYAGGLRINLKRAEG